MQTITSKEYLRYSTKIKSSIVLTKDYNAELGSLEGRKVNYQWKATINLPQFESFITHQFPSHHTLSPIHFFINDVDNTSNTQTPITSEQHCVSSYLRCPKTVSNHTNFPLFQADSNIIKIPSKVEYALKRLVSKKALKQIHPTFEVAVELCLLFISQLTSTYFGWKDGSNPEGWKPLKAAYLRQMLDYEKDTYKKIRELLEQPLRDGAFIECDYFDLKGVKCFGYRLCTAYIGKGIKSYELKTELARQLKQKYHKGRLKESKNNPICQNLQMLYPRITLPTINEIKERAKQLINSGYKSKKGKQLTFRNKHNNEYFTNFSDRTFVEDNIEAFEYLTVGGLISPRISSKHAGGRVVDSFVLMASFIRNMIKIDNEPIVEIDFACLHPNIAMSLYGGKQTFITHQMIADILNLPLTQVKIEHLSFFNKHPKEMEDSPLYPYYIETEPEMMKRLLKEKYDADRKHKITSQRMFEKEVAIMTDVFRILIPEGILAIYVYDALLCTSKHSKRVKEVMDEVVLKHGVFTTAKISSSSEL